MVKRRTPLVWQVMFEDTAWDRPESLAELVSDPHDVTAVAKHTWQRRPILLAAIGLILFCTFIIGYVLWRQAQIVYKEIEAEIKTAVDLESWGIPTGNHAVSTLLIDGDAPVDWRNQLVKQEYTQHRMVVLSPLLQKIPANPSNAEILTKRCPR